MTDLDAALDAANAEADHKEWLAARSTGFGCSDLPALWIILGWVGEDVFDWREEPAVDSRGKPTTRLRSDLYTDHRSGALFDREYVTPRYLAEMALPTKKTGLPRLIAEKAGLAKPRAQSDAQAEGKKKERYLFESSPWGRWDAQAFYAPDDERMAPPEWLDRAVHRNPLVIADREEPRLRATVEAWKYTEKGCIAGELKCDRLGQKFKCPWYWRVQAIGQAVVLGADAWTVFYGPRWALVDEPCFPDLADPVEFGPFKVREEDRKTVRLAVREGWGLVEAAKAR